MSEFSDRAIRLLIKERTGKRVSKDAVKQVKQELDQTAQDLAEDAIGKAEEDDRVTVRKKDVSKAVIQE